MCMKRCPHMEQPPQKKTAELASHTVGKCMRRGARGMQTKNSSPFNNAAAIKHALSHLLSHSACHHIGEIMDRVEMRQQLSAVREQPEAYQSSWRDSFMTSNAFLPRHLHRYLFKSSQNNFLSLLLLFSSFLFGAWMRCQVVT